MYDLVYNPPATRLLRDAANGGLPDHRRARHARGPGAGAVRVVDRHASAGGRHARGRARSGLRSLRTMKITSFDEFKELARRGTFVPVCKEIVADLLTPVSAFLKIAEHADYAFLLESVEGGEHVGRYSFLGKDPFLILRARDGKTTIERAGVTTESDGRSSTRCGADGRLPIAVRPGPAALHRRRGRISRLRRIVLVRAGAGRPGRQPPTAPIGRVHAVRHRARLRSRAAPDSDHREREDHGRRRP